MSVEVKSITKLIRRTFLIIITVMIIPSIFSALVSEFYCQKYDDIIYNINQADKIKQYVKNDIPNGLWEIVSGEKKFENSGQYILLDEIEKIIFEMKNQTNNKISLQMLEVANRIRLTLYKNVKILEYQIKEKFTVSENELILDEIRSICALFVDVLQEYTSLEVEIAYHTNLLMKRVSLIIFILQITILIFTIIFSSKSIQSLSKSINFPIKEMENMSTRIAEGDLSVRINLPKIKELDNLAENLNTMAKQIDLLIKQNIDKQKNLQKVEMKALQAQITPHFLYNTFDTIIWLAEEYKTEEVIKLTRAFSEFLRISLSRGHEWITVQQEIEHVKNYLTIQKVRYADILNFEINVDEELYNYKMLKLILQPLVENAIYHGIKNKRGRGHLKLSAEYLNEEKKFMKFVVEDDGAGFTEERLNQVLSEMLGAQENEEKLNSIYGLYNVNKKLILYYNSQNSGLKIESCFGKGSKIYFIIPCLNDNGESNV